VLISRPPAKMEVIGGWIEQKGDKLESFETVMLIRYRNSVTVAL
jgi:hypothetical protein